MKDVDYQPDSNTVKWVYCHLLDLQRKGLSNIRINTMANIPDHMVNEDIKDVE